LASGRIGLAVLRRLAPFDVRLHYFDTHRLSRISSTSWAYVPPDCGLLAQGRGRRIHATVRCTPRTYHLFDEALIGSMRRGSYIVNTARARSSFRDAVVAALESRAQLPATPGTSGTRSRRPPDHRGARARHEAMNPHVSVPACPPRPARRRDPRDPESFLAAQPSATEYLIVAGGGLAGTGRILHGRRRVG